MKKKDYTVRPALAGEWTECMDLAWRVFEVHNAPEYTEEGEQSFRDFIYSDTLERMFAIGEYRLFAAFDEDRPVGIISLRDHTHISLLFVDDEYQGTGVGTALVEYLAEYVRLEEHESVMTVNAAPGAVGFYHRNGFTDTGLQATTDGISYTPMEIYI